MEFFTSQKGLLKVKAEFAIASEEVWQFIAFLLIEKIGSQVILLFFR